MNYDQLKIVFKSDENHELKLQILHLMMMQAQWISYEDFLFLMPRCAANNFYYIQIRYHIKGFQEALLQKDENGKMIPLMENEKIITQNGAKYVLSKCYAYLLEKGIDTEIFNKFDIDLNLVYQKLKKHQKVKLYPEQIAENENAPNINGFELLDKILVKGIKKYLFTYSQGKEDGIMLLENLQFLDKLDQFIIKQNEYEELCVYLQTKYNGLQKSSNQVYQLWIFIQLLRLIMILSNNEFLGEIKFIIQSFVRSIIEHFLFCYLELKSIMILFLNQNTRMLRDKQLITAGVISPLIKCYSIIFNKDMSGIINQLFQKPDAVKQEFLEIYFAEEILYLRIKENLRLTLDQILLVSDYFSNDAFKTLPNILIQELMKLLGEQINDQIGSSKDSDPFYDLNPNIDIKGLFHICQKFMLSRTSYRQNYSWLYYTYQQVQAVHSKQSLLGPNSKFPQQLSEYIQQNYRVKEAKSPLGQLQEIIHNHLLDGKKTHINCFLFLLLIFYPHINDKVLAMILYQYYKSEKDPKLFNQFQNMICEDYSINRIILGAFYLLDQWSQEKNNFTKNYEGLKRNRKKIGIGLCRMSCYTEAIYNLEFYLSEQKYLHKLELGILPLDQQEDAVLIMKFINEARRNLNEENDFQEALHKLGFNYNVIYSKTNDYMNRINEFRKSQQYFEQKILNDDRVIVLNYYNFDLHMEQKKYWSISDMITVEQIMAQLVANYLKDQQSIKKQIDFIRICLLYSLKQTPAMKQDNCLLIYLASLLNIFEKIINKDESLQFEDKYSQLYFHYLLKMVSEQFPAMQKTYLQYKSQLAKSLYQEGKYVQALKIADKSQTRLISKCHSKMNNHYKGIDGKKLRLIIDSDASIAHSKYFSEFEEYLWTYKLAIRSDLYSPHIQKEYQKIYNERSSQQLSQYFKKPKRLEKFLMQYSECLEKIVQPSCDCLIQKEVSQQKEQQQPNICKMLFNIYLLNAQFGKKKLSETFARMFKIWYSHEKYRDEFANIFDKVKLEIPLENLAYSIEILITGVEIFKNSRNSLEQITFLLSRLCLAYPEQMIWWIGPLKRFNSNSSHKTAVYEKILGLVKRNKPETFEQLDQFEKQFNSLIKVSQQQYGNAKANGWSQEPISQQLVKDFGSYEYRIIFPSLEALTPPFKEPLKICNLVCQLEIAPSKDRPKKIKVVCSDKSVKSLLLKYEKYDSAYQGDTRREQRIIQLIQYLNKLLSPYNLKFPIFQSISLNQNNQLIEWVEDTTTLKRAINFNFSSKIKNILNENEWKEVLHQESKLEIYLFDQRTDPEQWLQSQTNFIKTMAIWSVFSYMVGFGDRHYDNILIDKDFNVIHIDYDCLFHKGSTLPVPEIVDFRLTKNLRHCMGFLQDQGMFKKYMIQALQIFVKNKRNIVSFLDPYIYDPLQCRYQVNVSHLIQQKLNIQDFQQQVDMLIEKNKDQNILQLMFVGWSPYV